jgi:cytochrome c oxidase cbb3-type subunit III
MPVYRLGMLSTLAIGLSTLVGGMASGTPSEPQATADPQSPNGAELYGRYCATCHGPNGEGNRAEHANSLRSSSFLNSVSDDFLDNAIRYGREDTAMAGYGTVVGGPLTDADITAVAAHIRQFGRFRPLMNIAGDEGRGRDVYNVLCVRCHGRQGEGTSTAPRLNDPLFLYMASASFLRHAIEEGRENTQMPAFGRILTVPQLDDVTTYLRSWGRQWVQPTAVSIPTTDLRQSVLNPHAETAALGPLRNDRYVAATALKQTLDARTRLVLLDTRPASAWAKGHIPGAASLPYHDVESKAAELPTDGTWIVAYCSCPTHLADATVDALRAKGFTHTAVLDGGLAAWVAKGYALAAQVSAGSQR